MEVKAKSWKDITIAQYLTIEYILGDKESYKGELGEFERQQRLLAALADSTYEEAQQLQVKEYYRLSKQIAFLSKPQFAEKPARTFKLNGVKYEINLNITDLSAAQYIDILTYCNNTQNINDNLHKIMAVICSPVKKTWYGKKIPYVYNGLDSQRRADIFYQHLTMDIAYPVAVFFYNLWKVLIKDTLNSLEKETDQAIVEAMKILEEEVK